MDSRANPLADAMKRLWANHLPELEARVAALESCTQVLRSDADPSQALVDAASAAHKLAGVLGTFGLQHGTDIARNAELECGNFSGDKDALAQKLNEVANSLRAMFASKT